MKDPAFIHNPFPIEGFTKKPFIQKAKELVSHALVNKDTGETEALYSAPRSAIYDVDSLQYVKFFKGEAKRLARLSNNGKTLMFYIQDKLKIHNDIVWLNPDDVSVWCEVSVTSVYRAIQELVDQKILARKLGSRLEYWVNTNIVFNGNRLRIKK